MFQDEKKLKNVRDSHVKEYRDLMLKGNLAQSGVGPTDWLANELGALSVTIQNIEGDIVLNTLRLAEKINPREFYKTRIPDDNEDFTEDNKKMFEKKRFEQVMDFARSFSARLKI